MQASEHILQRRSVSVLTIELLLYFSLPEHGDYEARSGRHERGIAGLPLRTIRVTSFAIDL